MRLCNLFFVFFARRRDAVAAPAAFDDLAAGCSSGAEEGSDETVADETASPCEVRASTAIRNCRRSGLPAASSAPQPAQEFD